MYQLKSAKEFREEARTALRGNWWIGALAALIATLLSASTLFNAATIGDNGILSSVTERLPMYPEYQQSMIFMVGLILSAVAFFINIIIFLIAGPFTLGYIQFNMKMLNGEKPKFKDLFAQFKRFKEGLSVLFFRWLLVLLWALAGVGIACIVTIPFAFLAALGKGGRILFVIVCLALSIAVGIFICIKMYGYALAPYIVYDNPGLGGMEALKKSTRLMNGNKARLFGLVMSFIGWSLLANLPYFICTLCFKEAVLFSLPFCVGTLWVKAYQEASFAAFYKQIVAEDNKTLLFNEEPKEYVLGKGNLDDVESIVETSRWNY